MATSVRCERCNTTLIYEATGHSKEYRQTVRSFDQRMYSGLGGFFGLFLTFAALKFVFTEHWLSDGEIYSIAVVAGVIGSILGKLFARSRTGY